MAESKATVNAKKTNNHPSGDLGDVYYEICTLVHEVQIIAGRQTEAERISKIDQFFGCEPPTFGEDTDPLHAKHWVLELENIFDCIDCSDEQKVAFAGLRLKMLHFHGGQCKKKLES